MQLLKCGDKVLLRNAQRDSRKGGKFNKRWLGPYTINDYLGKGIILYKLENAVTGHVLKKAVNVCLLKIYNDPIYSSSKHESCNDAILDGSSSKYSSQDASQDDTNLMSL